METQNQNPKDPDDLPSGIDYSINPNTKIEIDYNRYDQAVQKLKPRVYLDGTTFFCLSGPDRETGIFGRGDTLEGAIQDWRSALEERFKRINGEHV